MLTKILVGGAIILGTAIVVHIAKKYEKKYVDSDGNEVKKDEESLKEKVEKKVVGGLVKVTEWAFNHMDELRGATVLISLVASILDIVRACRSASEMDRIESKIDILSKKMEAV